jgi:hypothetical protein
MVLICISLLTKDLEGFFLHVFINHLCIFLRELSISICTFGFFFCLFWWDWGLNSGPHACAVLVEPHFQSILLWLFWSYSLPSYLPRVT